MFLFSYFVTFIYQPFLNILVLFYWVDNFISHGHPDMGIAVIFLTIIIRILLLPLSLAEEQSDKERRAMMQQLAEIDAKFSHDPIAQRAERKNLFHRNRTVVVGEIISLIIQVIIALMLWKMFETGLPGEDIHLIYKFMPKVNLPFNLIFLGKYDLSRPNFALNIMQSVMIFLVETAGILTSPYPPMKGEVVRLQLVLPVISFIIFLALPAGKKVFVITTLIISLIIIIYKFIRRKIKDYADKVAQEELLAAQQAAAAAGTVPGVPPTTLPTAEKVLVEVK